MSAGGQENPPPFATAGGAEPIPTVVPTPWWRRPPQPRLNWVSRGVFVVLLLALSVLFIYPFLWLVSASFKPNADVFDNRLIPLHWHWNYTGPNKPEPFPQYLFNIAPVGHWIFNSFWISFLGAGL